MPLQLANTYKTKAIAFARIKKDPADTRILAHPLRSNLISPCHIDTVASRGNKHCSGTRFSWSKKGPG